MGVEASGQELAGCCIGITASRRADELAGMLERHGARVVHVPALRVVPGTDDDEVLATTREVLRLGADVVVVTTGYGLKRWLQVAAAGGLDEDLRALLASSQVLCRGGKARGTAIAEGLSHATAADGTTASVVERLLAQGVAGRHVVVQAHALGDQAAVDALEAAGARVTMLVPYQWADADDGSRLPALLADVAARRVGAITFSAAPAVDAVFDVARHHGLEDVVLDALRSGDVLAATVGPVTAAPLQELGIDALVPERHRTGAMVKLLCATIAERASAGPSTPRG